MDKGFRITAALQDNPEICVLPAENAFMSFEKNRQLRNILTVEM